MASKKSSKSKSKAKVALMTLAVLAAAGAEGLTAEYASVQHLVEAGDAEINPGYGDGGIDADGLCQVRATDQGLKSVEVPAVIDEVGIEKATSLFDAPTPSETGLVKAKSTGYEIADSVPVPPVSGRGRGAGGSKYPFAALEVGQSFFVPDSEGGKHGAARTMGSAVSIANKRFDGQRKFIVRAVSENGTTGARVWRVAIEG